MLYRIGGVSLVLASLFACGGSDGTPIDDEGLRIFNAANAAIHELHLDAQELETWPDPYVWPCPDGGTATMTSRYEGETLVDLLHVLEGCRSGRFVFDGSLDYVQISTCDPGFRFDIQGELMVSGDVVRTCAFDAEEACSGYRGEACGGQL